MSYCNTLLAAIFAAILTSSCGGSGGDKVASVSSMQSNLILGETLMLSAQQFSPLRYPVQSVKNVWGVDNAGNIIEFKENIDWIRVSTGISRTSNSRIPDFSTYSLIRDSQGKFEFTSEPRNPPLTLTFQVYVDYFSPHSPGTVHPAVGSIKPSSVVCLGDSITAGAHTLANFFLGTDDDSYCGLIRKYLGSTASVTNPSVPGGTLASALPSYPSIISQKPDLIILAFGMNDHIEGAEALPTFESNLINAVRTAQDNDVRIILIGFFQQNPDWILEDPAMTVAYNGAIKRVSDLTGAKFIDINDRFLNSSPNAQYIESRTGDYLHHPNNFGHRLYFSLILPEILTESIDASLLPYYIDPLN